MMVVGPWLVVVEPDPPGVVRHTTRDGKGVAEQRGSAQRMSAAIGTEKGSDARITASDALGQLQAKAQKYAEEKGVTFEAAMDAVSQANPDLYRKYQAEKRG
jgi:hypothetical protein